MRIRSLIAIVTLLTLSAALIAPSVSAQEIATKSLAGYFVMRDAKDFHWWHVDPKTRSFQEVTAGSEFANIRAMAAGITEDNLYRIPYANFGSGTKPDSDGDGLSDSFENAIGTNTTLADTDGDGYSDGDEVSHGYSPVGPGKPFFDAKFTRAQAGRIFVQKEHPDRLWYVNPRDGKRYLIATFTDFSDFFKKVARTVSAPQLPGYVKPTPAAKTTPSAPTSGTTTNAPKEIPPFSASPLADLSLKGTHLAPTQSTPGYAATYIDIYNAGTTSVTTPYKVWVRAIADAKLYEGDVLSHPAGSTQSVQLNLLCGVSYQVTIDPHGWVTESDKTNNTSLIAAECPPDNADLVVKDIAPIAASKLRVGMATPIKVAIGNNGTFVSKPFSVRVANAKGETIYLSRFNGWGAQTSSDFTFKYSCPTAGSTTLEIDVDYGNEIKETDERNQNMITYDCVDTAELEILSISVSGQAAVGNDVFLDIQERNTGKKDSGEYKTLIKHLGTGQELMSADPSIAAGVTRTRRVRWTCFASGNHELELTINTGKTIFESDYNNNSKRVSVLCQ